MTIAELAFDCSPEFRAILEHLGIADAVTAASTAKEGPTFVSIGESEAIEKRFPNYESIEIVANAFGSSPPKPPEAVETIGFTHYIVAHRTLNENDVGEFARLLYGARQTRRRRPTRMRRFRFTRAPPPTSTAIRRPFSIATTTCCIGGNPIVVLWVGDGRPHRVFRQTRAPIRVLRALARAHAIRRHR